MVTGTDMVIALIGFLNPCMFTSAIVSHYTLSSAMTVLCQPCKAYQNLSHLFVASLKLDFKVFTKEFINLTL